MPPEKRPLDYDHSRSHKKSKRDEPPDWRAAHFDDQRSRRKHNSSYQLDKSSERSYDRDRDRDYDRSRDRDRDRDYDRERSHRSKDDYGGGGSSHHRSISESRDSSQSRSRPPPTDAKTLDRQAHAPPDDEKEEGEISPRMTIDSLMNEPAVGEPLTEIDLIEEKPVIDDGEARKARRAAILAKYQQNNATGSNVNTLNVSAALLEKVNGSPLKNESFATPPPSTPMETGAVPSPAPAMQEEEEDFSLTKEQADPIAHQDDLDLGSPTKPKGDEDGVAAADYDPSQDMRDDVRRAAQMVDGALSGEEVSEYEEDDDEDIDDIFAMAGEVEKKPKKKKRVVKKPVTVVRDTIDTAADEEGYYQIVLGEFLDSGRYQVYAVVGKGMFSIVVKAWVCDPDGDKEKHQGEVAIKIVRSQESMYKAGLKEVQILQKLRQGDPEDKKHLVKLERTFEHRGHLCLVFESLSMNLRDTVKKYGRDVGLHLKAVRVYGHQLFLALSLLRKCNILHADIKPDNILINESRSNLKLCDLGSAADITYENTAIAITPYLVSRFYRAPEIILGMPYDYAVDVWSVGCTLYELYTGRILFPGRSNREMLKLMMEVKGRVNQKVIKKAKFGNVYFDEGGGFLDVVEGNVGSVTKTLHFTKPTRDLRSRLAPGEAHIAESEEKQLAVFVDLLDKCLQMDPTRRITPKDALLHPFIRG